jgi:hypothetical protein
MIIRFSDIKIFLFWQWWTCKGNAREWIFIIFLEQQNSFFIHLNLNHYERLPIRFINYSKRCFKVHRFKFRKVFFFWQIALFIEWMLKVFKGKTICQFFVRKNLVFERKTLFLYFVIFDIFRHFMSNLQEKSRLVSICVILKSIKVILCVWTSARP